MKDIKVLLVDDEEEFLQSLSERLELRDVRPKLARDGEEALARIREDEPTVIVLDLKMPGMHGLEVLRRVKKAHPHVQIVILTGHGTEKDREEAERLGAFAYLRKPVSMDKLMSTIAGAYRKFRSLKRTIDTAFMASAMSQAGELELAREIMREEEGREDE